MHDSYRDHTIENAVSYWKFQAVAVEGLKVLVSLTAEIQQVVASVSADVEHLSLIRA